MERIKILLLVGSGGFIGSILRYLLSVNISHKFLSTVPSGTLLVNTLGCFIIGIVFGAGEAGQIPSSMKFFLTAGICGGFTTFSAFTIESYSLLKGEMYGTAIVYIIASIVLGLSAALIGIVCTRFF